MLGDAHARKYSKNGARTHSILEKFAFDTTLKNITRTISFSTQHDKKMQEKVVHLPKYF